MENTENTVDELDTTAPTERLAAAEVSNAEINAETENINATEIAGDESAEKKPSNLDKDARWYVLHTFSNYEVVAKDNLEKVIEKYGLQNRVFEILIPTEETVVEKNDKKVLVPTKVMPSYVFIKMIYGDDLWHTITRTHGVTGFVGPKGRPLPLSPKEVIDMKLERKFNINIKLEVNDTIHVIDGPLAGQTAVVTAVDAINGKCSITVNMFGRPTSVDLYTSQIKKL